MPQKDFFKGLNIYMFYYLVIITIIISLLPLFFIQLRSGIYAWVFGPTMIIGWMIIIIRNSLLQSKEIESELKKSGWEKLPFVWQVLFTVILSATILITWIFLHGTGTALFFLPIVFSISALVIKKYVHKLSQKQKQGL